jgi:hypothetical protein
MGEFVLVIAWVDTPKLEHGSSRETILRIYWVQGF